MSDSVSTLMLRILAQDEASAAFAKVARSAETAEGRMTRLGKGASDAGRKMSLGLTLPIAAVGLASLKLAGDFDSSMAQFRIAANQSGESLTAFSDLAKQLGADTQYSANEAAQAMLGLAKAGLAPAEIKAGALKSTMALAAAGSISLAEATTSLTGAMNTFGIKGSESVTVADALAGAANASSADVSDLALGLQQAGQQAQASGLTLQETTGVIAAFAQAGMKGSDAGTSLKTMLQRLAAPSKAASNVMHDLGLKFFDAHGQMKPVSAIADQLKTRLSGLTQQQRLQAMQTMFGSDATRAANVLFTEGSAGLKKYTDATSKAGNAQEMAEAKMAGWNGTLEKLKGSVETAGLAAGTVLVPMATKIAHGIEIAADKFSSLDEGSQKFIVNMATFAAVAGPALWAFGSIAKTVSNVSTGVKGLARMFGLNTSATVADTVATNANTLAKQRNAAASNVPGSFMRAQKVGPAQGAGLGTAAAGAGMGTFLVGLTAAIAAAVAATYVATKEVAKQGAVQAPGQSGATAGGTSAGWGKGSLQYITANKERIATERLLNDVVRSSVPNIDRQSQAYVRASLAMGVSTDGLKERLKVMGLTPRQIVTAFKADPEDLQTKAAAARKDLNELKQTRIPSIRAEAGQLRAQLKQAQDKVNSLKQKDPTNVRAIDLASVTVQRIQNNIANLHDKDITITTWYKSYASAADQSTGNKDRHGVGPNKAIGGLSGGPTIVGERGREIVDLPPGSRVYTHSDSLSMLRGLDGAAKGKGARPLSAWQKKIAAWRKSRQGAVTDAYGSLSGLSASVMDFAADSSAAGDVTSTKSDVFNARRALNNAGPNERRAAVEALTVAQDAYTAAVKRSNAVAVTSANITKSMGDKRAKVQRLLGNLRKLSGMGLDPGMLRSIASGDLDSAVANTDAMVKGGRTAVYVANAENNATSKAQSGIAALLGSLATPKPVHKVQHSSGAHGARSMQVNLHIDGKRVHTSLLDLKKRQGKNSKLGLD